MKPIVSVSALVRACNVVTKFAETNHETVVKVLVV